MEPKELRMAALIDLEDIHSTVAEAQGRCRLQWRLSWRGRGLRSNRNDWRAQRRAEGCVVYREQRLTASSMRKGGCGTPRGSHTGLKSESQAEPKRAARVTK